MTTTRVHTIAKAGPTTTAAKMFVADVALDLGVTAKRIYQMIDEGVIKMTKFRAHPGARARYEINRSDFRRWKKRQRSA